MLHVVRTRASGPVTSGPPPREDGVELLERESALVVLAEAAAEAGTTGCLVLVAGEAGVGKTALLEHFASEHTEASWAWGACDGLFTPRPLAPLYDVAEQLGGRLPSLLRSHADRGDLFDETLTLLTGSPDPVVLVVEDIHWADEATLDLLRFLSRRSRGAGMLLIATYRPVTAGANPPLELTLGELVNRPGARRIDLAPLSQQTVAEMASRAGRDATTLFHLTGGNPFFLGEVLRAGPDEVPPSARDAVLAHAARLGVSSRRLLDTAALIGTTVDPQLLCQATGSAPDDLDLLAGTGLVLDDGTSLRFRHELARRAVDEAVPVRRRTALHGRILAALHTLGSTDDVQLAFHAEQAGDGPATLRYAINAATRAARLASHREAAAQFERALRFAADEPERARASLHHQFADELRLIDRWEEAADNYLRALESWRRVGDQLQEGTVQWRLSAAMWRLARGTESSTAAHEAVRVLEPLGPTIELAWAYDGLGRALSIEGRTDEALALLRQAREMATELGAYAVVSNALNTEAMTGPDDWEPPLLQSLQIALEHGAEEQAGRAYANLHSAYVSEFRVADAERVFAEGVAYGDAHDMSTYVHCLRGLHVEVLSQAGRWDEALELGTGLLENRTVSAMNRLVTLVCVGVLLARRGSGEAGEMLAEALRIAESSGDPGYVTATLLAVVEEAWLRGDPRAVRDAERLDDIGSSDRWTSGMAAVWLRRTGSARTVTGPAPEPLQRELEGDVAGAARLWRARGCPYEAVLALAGSTDAADLREALAECDRLGAAATARWIRRRMRELGMRSVPVGRRSATREHPLGLTAREHDVLLLLVEGCTDSQIADRLVISPRTVGHHVSSILAKLEVSTRREAASHARRLGA